MDLKYFKEQIHEELEGARDYIDKAVEAKVSNPAWCSTFAHMADAEADHAGKLMAMTKIYLQQHPDEKIAHNTITPATGTSTQSMVPASEVYKTLMKDFGETMTYVTNMKRGLI